MSATQEPPVREHAERKWVGQSIRRLEDPKFLRGHGNYIDDLHVEGMLHAAIVRSPHAHAKILSIDVTAARALEGVVAVITGAEAVQLADPLPDFGPAPDKFVWRLLAADKVRYVGEGVAAIVATSRYIAEDASDLVEVEYEPLPVLQDPEEALKDGAPLVHETLESNIGYQRVFQFGDVEADFAAADVVVSDRLHWHRSGAQPLETVGAVASYDHGTGMMEIHANSLSFTSYLFMMAMTLKIPENRLDITPHPAGGSFGSKLWAVKVSATAGMLSKAVGRPVKYVEDRIDNMSNCDHHGSDRIYYCDLALTRDGEFKAIRIRTIEDYGAYMHFGVGHHGNALAQVTGPYRIGSVEYDLKAVVTNKCQQGAYRGFGSEVNNWMLERMVDLAARELEIDPAELRRRNFIAPDQFPYYIPTGNVYDSGEYEQVLDKALGLAEYKHWRAEQQRLRAEGRYIGIGMATCQERSVFSATEFWFWFDEPAAPVTSMPESITVRVGPTGDLTATLYSCASWGNSPETMTAQLLAEEFDVDPHSVTVTYAGTRNGLPATGPGGSRLTVMLAGAVEGAAVRIKDKARIVAEHMLEASADDLEWVDGGFQVKGSPDSRASLGDIAIQTHLFKHSLPEEIESGLEASKVYDHPFTTMPSADRKNLGVFYPIMGHACHIPIIEIDIETGHVTFIKYIAVHDCGTLVNPRSLAGHITGGTVQGIGTALFEEYVYAEDGNLLTQSYMDYLIPTAMEAPEFVIGHVETPSPWTVHGIKGGGEGGRMMAPAAIAGAIDDALAPFGVRTRELPATPERIVAMIEQAESAAAGADAG